MILAKIEEKKQLADVIARLQTALETANERLAYYAQDIQSQKTYLWENRSEMDHIEKIASRESIQQAVSIGETVLAQKQRLLKLLRSPYFGRFDFTTTDQVRPEAVYIGVHHFYDEVERKNRVYDWRAPIATLFYDYETGPACYTSPQGEITGDITLKRQFRINNGTIELMIDSAVNVVDDVLQEELSRAADDRMKNIVATIQRDQNAIIRNEHAPVLVIQGVAGSGKTSIALHRIAFLLYRFKDTLTSADILIISPNRVFATYIANVLPELGEESIAEIGMETLAHELLDGQYRFQSFFAQSAALTEKNDTALQQRIRFKASADFLRLLSEYAAYVEKNRFVAEDLWIGGRWVPGWLLEEIFRKHRSLGLNERLKQTAQTTEQQIGNQYNYNLQPEDRRQLRAALRKMVRQSSLRATYQQFFTWLGQPEYFKRAKRGILEYADVFPLIYLKMLLEGVPLSYRRVKHLLIDEMQDYTPVQYAVIARLFTCKKTILGDINQSVNPYSASSVREIQKIFTQAACVTLNKSYRSSYEITQFTQRIVPNPELIAIERHGEAPQMVKCKHHAEELERLSAMLHEFSHSDYNTLSLICKTQQQAHKFHAALTAQGHTLQLLSEDSLLFHKGIILCTAHLAKGLEFDCVIIPDVTERAYNSSLERNLLYVACTRAMHRLTLTYTGKRSPLVVHDEPVSSV
jgi:DNA helicase-2/ATP-dependent DNA helicase PcrA